VLTGGAPVPERLIRAYLDRGVTPLQGYGLSEAGPLVLLLDPDSALTKVGSAGRPPPLVDVRTVHPDDTEVAPGETGELLARGPNVMAGYWNRPDATRNALTSDGWLRTGDSARRDDDDDGYALIVGRVADAFLSQGRTVHPRDVERVLAGHPSVDDAGVAHVPTRDGHAVVGAVVPSAGTEPTEDDILAFARRHLAPHRAPTSVTFVDRLPRSSVGKLMRGGGADDVTPEGVWASSYPTEPSVVRVPMRRRRRG
jgi:fatty-acyl-CoA synthase